MVVMALGHFGCAIIVTTSAAADHGDDLGHAGESSSESQLWCRNISLVTMYCKQECLQPCAPAI